jgi:hypothetical protein
MKDETELQTASRWQMVLAELSHSGEVEICSKKLSSGLRPISSRWWKEDESSDR